jgi:hypothetical protein
MGSLHGERFVPLLMDSPGPAVVVRFGRAKNQPYRFARTVPVPKKLPVKLAKEPLLEAVCELRVESGVELHAVVPGLLYTKLSNIRAIEQLPVSNVPAEVRASFPELSDAPLVRLSLDHYFIQQASVSGLGDV